jgi:REP element-mobilizing transposase RayT
MPAHAVRQRRTIRLRDYDYSSTGIYFVTICTHGRACLFGEVIDGRVRLSEIGEIVREEWEKTAVVRSNLLLDEFVVMPNHFHAIIIIDNVGATHRVALDDPATENRATHRVAPTSPGLITRSLGAIVGQFKSAVTKQINLLRNTPGVPVWQRNYYERVIRDDRELAAIREYIAANPAWWSDDENHPARL